MSQIVQTLVDTARRLPSDGLVRGAGGNVSAREDDIMWISPSGMSFEDAGTDDYPGVSISTGDIVHGSRRPSSEVLMHLAIYRRRPEVTAVIHTHPPMTQALTAAGHTLKPMFADYYVYVGTGQRGIPTRFTETHENGIIQDMVQKAYLAIDMGASSGRHLLGLFDGRHLRLDEVYRFSNGPIELNGHLHWNLLDLWSQIRCGLRAAGSKRGDSIVSVGVDRHMGS